MENMGIIQAYGSPPLRLKRYPERHANCRIDVFGCREIVLGNEHTLSRSASTGDTLTL